MKNLNLEFSNEEWEQIENIIDYTDFENIVEYINYSLNQIPKYSNFNEPNNLQNIEAKGVLNGSKRN